MCAANMQKILRHTSDMTNFCLPKQHIVTCYTRATCMHAALKAGYVQHALILVREGLYM